MVYVLFAVKFAVVIVPVNALALPVFGLRAIQSLLAVELSTMKLPVPLSRVLKPMLVQVPVTVSIGLLVEVASARFK